MVPTVAFHTLGCKVNQGETAAMAELFRDADYRVLDFSEEADIYVIHSCAVTTEAERKSRHAAKQARRRNAAAFVVMVGCYPQVAREQNRLPEDVDLLIGSALKAEVVELVEQAREAPLPVVAVPDFTTNLSATVLGAGQESERTRGTLKVQDGCRQFCSYCIIPYARGPERSRPLPLLLAEAQDLIEAGFKEIVVTGIHVGSYGRDLSEGYDLVTLLEGLLRTPGLQRLRLSSIEPNEVSPALMELFASHSNFCRHLHIPLQSGHDRVLQAMNRRYTTATYAATIDMVRSYVPDLALTTDVIVGFPGETEEEFAATSNFIADMAFSRLHVFRYSRRPGTPAAKMLNQVPVTEKKRRSRALIDLGDSLARKYKENLIGQEVEVLWESRSEDGIWLGHTDTYVTLGSDSSALSANSLTRVLVLAGKPEEESSIAGSVAWLQH